MTLSHIAHWLSVVQLWFLATLLTGRNKDANSSVPYRAALLHIISPAGIFLSTPNAESSFAFLSMSGFLAYAYAVQQFNRSRGVTGSAAMVVAGAVFGLATIYRSNGILAGITFLVEASGTAYSIVTQGPPALRIVRLTSVVIGGLLIAIGLAVPQVMAFQEYCLHRSNDVRRGWCNRSFPSIFAWVQDHYW